MRQPTEWEKKIAVINWMFVPLTPHQSLYAEILSPSAMEWGGRAFGRWSVLCKRDPRELLPPSASWEHSEKTKTTIHESGGGASSGTESTRALTLDFSASREAIQPTVTCYSSSHRPSNQISDKSLVSKIYKEHLNSITKRYPNSKWAKDLYRHFSKEEREAIKHKRCSASLVIRVNVGQIPDKVPLHKVLGAELCSFKKLISPASEQDPIWRKGLYRGNEIKIGHQGQSESNMIGVLIKKANKEYTEGRCDVKTHRENVPWKGRD